MAKRLLTDTEACIHLGITKELLYAYIRYPAKKSLKHDRKLISEEVDGKNMFDEAELDSFDAYLKEPWSEEGEKRPEIPAYIQKYLETEIGGSCPITKKGFPLDNAHIEDYSISRSHHHHNIIRIAKDEHTKFDSGILSKESLKQTKDRLVENLRQKLRIESTYYKVSTHSPKPHQLFIGRDLELIKLIESMGTKRLVIIEGIGGVGKTQLLLNALDTFRDENLLIWIDIETISTFDDLILLITNEISKIEGVSIEGSLIDTLFSMRMTIVLDSLENLLIPYRDEVEDFIQLLMTRTDGVQLLITSQIDLSIFDHEKALIKLEGLTDQGSTVILNSLLNDSIEVDEDQLKWILWFCGGHPLSLKLTSSLINFYKSSKKAIELLKNNMVLEQPLRKNHNKSSALSICLDTVYSELTDDQKKILHFSKFFPVGVRTSWLNSIFAFDSFDTEIAILQQFFLIENRLDRLRFERILIQNPFRIFLYDCSRNESLLNHNKQEREVLLFLANEASMINRDYIETSKEGSAQYGILRMEVELPNIMEAFHISDQKLYEDNEDGIISEYETVANSISFALGKYYSVRGNYEQAILITEARIKYCLMKNLTDSLVEHYFALSDIQSKQYDFKGAENTIHEMDALIDKTENENAILCSHWMKGRLKLNLDEYEDALAHLKKALKMMLRRKNDIFPDQNLAPSTARDENLYLEVTGNIGMVYSEIAAVYEYTKKPELALKYFQLGLEILLSQKDEINALVCYYGVANSYSDLGQFDEAIGLYLLCVKAHFRMGNGASLCNAMTELGRLCEQFPEITKRKELTEVTFHLALGNLAYRIKNFERRLISQNGEFLEVNIPDILLAQCILLLKLTSLTDYYYLLFYWANNVVDELKFIHNRAGHFAAILNLTHEIGRVHFWINLSNEKKEPSLRKIYLCCLDINGISGIDNESRIFYWLAQWFRHVKLDEEATAEKLWNQALNYVE